MLQVQEEHEDNEDSEAIEKAKNETKNEDNFLYKEQIIVFGHVDLEPEIDDHDDLDDWVMIDHEWSVVFWFKNQEKKIWTLRFQNCSL